MRKNKLRKKKAPPRKVSFEHNDEDFTVAVLCNMGYATAAIAAAVCMTEGQVNYRITKAGLQWARHNFRNGTSTAAVNQLQDFLDMNRVHAENLACVFGESLDHSVIKGKKLKLTPQRAKNLRGGLK